MFRDTITCPTCREHFTSMLTVYRAAFPNMLASRQDFAMFTFRAHNAVNRRLRKPIFGTLEECMTTLKSNIKTRIARDFRVSYINHITRYWKTFQDVTGITALKKIAEMKKIEIEYVAPRDRNFEVQLRADVVVLPQDMLEKKGESEPATPFRFSSQSGGGGFRITAGGLRLRM